MYTSADTYIALTGAVTVAAALGFYAWTRWFRTHPRSVRAHARAWWTKHGWHWSPPAYLTLHVAIGLAATLAALAGFAQLADWVSDKAAITRFDVHFDDALHAGATPTGIAVAKALSLIGGPVSMALLGLAGTVYYAVRRERTMLVGWMLAFGGGGLLDLALKTFFHRPRPMFADPIAHGYGYSFPSGHSMGSLIGFGMLAYLVMRAERRPAPRALVATAAALLVLAIGASRLYLGVHFPSDVLGGFTAGVMWLGACISGLEIATPRPAADSSAAPPSRADG